MERFETGLLAPYRACGLICSEVQPAYLPLTNTPIQGELQCVIDNVVCIYSINPFRLNFVVTDKLENNASLVASNKKYLFVVAYKSIFIYKHVDHKQKVFRVFNINNVPKLLLPCGENNFVVVDDQKNLFVYDIKNNYCINEFELPKSFNATAIVHPLTYKNQVLIGSEDGRMRIVDIEKGTLVREFISDKNFNCKITVLTQSTAVDVIAVGMADGRIHLRNIKIDKVLFSFQHEGCITALSFRNDGIETLISGNSDGSIAVWDLDKQILVGLKTDVHDGPIVSLNFLVGEAFFISSSTDNKLIKWILKDELALPEEIKTIEGPSSQVSTIAFTSNRSLLLASRDGCMRQFFSFQHDNSLKRMGIAREFRNKFSKNRFIDVRMSPIVEMQTVHAREAVWDNVICRHENSPLVSTWSTRKLTRGTLLLYHSRFQSDSRYLAAYATSIFLSSCGTFALIGSSSGHLDVFNMQSGKHYFSFVNPSNKKTEDEKDGAAHKGHINGLSLDCLNNIVVSGASDSSLYFWSFKSKELLKRVTNPDWGGVLKFELNRFNSLLAVSFGNNDLVIVDVLCQNLARRFEKSHSGKITALTFSPDGKWLVSSDDQCIIKVWDLLTNNLIDIMRCSIHCIGISFNETGEYLATIHEGQRGIYIWANKALFMNQYVNLSVRDGNSCPSFINLPNISSSHLTLKNTSNKLESEDESDNEEEIFQVVVIDEDEVNENDISKNLSSINNENNIKIDQLSNDLNLVTLSGLPSSRWANLPQLKLIKERNKPIEPVKKPKNAPFFLPGTDSLEGFSFDKLSDKAEDKMDDIDDKENLNNVLMAKRSTNISLQSEWEKKLLIASENEMIEQFNKLKAMNISAIDLQIRSLSSSSFYSFLKMLLIILKTRQNFELIQSYLASFLNIHNESLWSYDYIQLEKESEKSSSLTDMLEKLLLLLESTWLEIQNLIDANTSLSQWIKSALI